MARPCKCAATGEKGTTDKFIKIDGKYFKSKEIYDEYQKQKEEEKQAKIEAKIKAKEVKEKERIEAKIKEAKRKELIDYVCREFLGYGDGQPFNTLVPAKIKELSYYDYDVILETFKRNIDKIHYQLENKVFINEMQKISYMFGIIRNSVADVNAEFKRKQKQEAIEKSTVAEYHDLFDIGTKASGKDISSFLCDDDF